MKVFKNINYVHEANKICKDSFGVGLLLTKSRASSIVCSQALSHEFETWVLCGHKMSLLIPSSSLVVMLVALI